MILRNVFRWSAGLLFLSILSIWYLFFKLSSEQLILDEELDSIDTNEIGSLLLSSKFSIYLTSWVNDPMPEMYPRLYPACNSLLMLVEHTQIALQKSNGYRKDGEHIYVINKTKNTLLRFGVDGTVCSFRLYLSVVERFCPPMEDYKMDSSKLLELQAETNINIAELFELMTDRPSNFEFIKSRIEHMWPVWLEAATKNEKEHPITMQNRRKLNILVHLGFLEKENKFKIIEGTEHGGPLGELVQWADLLASLHILGHKLFISSDRTTLSRHIAQLSNLSPCPLSGNRLDLAITDIIGLRTFRRHKAFINENVCRVRVVDSFGTHVEFNYKSYFNTHKKELGGASKNPWGGHTLQLLQYWTYFPHTPDNDFLGFVVDSDHVEPLFSRESRNAVLVYGKSRQMWAGMDDVVRSLQDMGVEVHATVGDDLGNETALNGVINHGVLPSRQMQELLASVRAFIGLGFPYEGPAALEAVARGAVFINPRFDPPHSRRNTPFFAEKPTNRELTSQCPYMELLGPPNVYTVNIHDRKELQHVVKEILSSTVQPFVPEELTATGMMLRVHLMTSRRNLCSLRSNYPPFKALEILVGDEGFSCESACDNAGMVCEPSFFSEVNTEVTLNKSIGDLHVKNHPVFYLFLLNGQPCLDISDYGNHSYGHRLMSCDRTTSEASVTAPRDCVLQTSNLLFSCSSKPLNSTVKRYVQYERVGFYLGVHVVHAFT